MHSNILAKYVVLNIKNNISDKEFLICGKKQIGILYFSDLLYIWLNNDFTLLNENEIIIRCNKIKTESYYTIKSIGYKILFLKNIYKDI